MKSSTYFYTSMFCFVLATAAILTTISTRLYFSNLFDPLTNNELCLWRHDLLGPGYLECKEHPLFGHFANLMMLLSVNISLFWYYLFCPLLAGLSITNLYLAVQFPKLLIMRFKDIDTSELASNSERKLKKLLKFSLVLQIVSLLIILLFLFNNLLK